MRAVESSLDAAEVRDQPERTVMAWDRTGVALMVVGALYMRTGQPPYSALRHVPGVIAMLYGAALIGLAYRRYERVRTKRDKEESVASERLVVATGVITVVFAASALALIAFPG